MSHPGRQKRRNNHSVIVRVFVSWCYLSTSYHLHF